MSFSELNGAIVAPSGVATIDDSSTSGLILPEQPELVIAQIDASKKQFKYFKPPREPKITERGDNYLYEYETDENGKPRRLPNGRLAYKKDASGNKIPVLDENGNKVIKRKRKGKQVCNVEIERCIRAVETREKAIALAEKKLASAKTPAAIEKAKERLEVAVLRRDTTVKRLDMMLEYAKQHNIPSIAKRENSNFKDQERKTLFTGAAQKIKHVIAVREDIALTAAIKAGGSRSHDAFDKLRTEYKWLVNKFARPGKTPLELEDAFARGVEGLWDAAMRFDATRSSATYSTVAFNWVYRNTRARTRADAKPGQMMIDGELKYSVSIDGQYNNDDEEQTEFSMVSTESSVLSDSLKYDVAEALASLDAQHQAILQMRHFSNLSYDEISKRVNMPVSLVKQLTTEAHSLLQQKLKAYGA